MELTKERQKEKRARDKIVDALREYHAHEPSVPAFTIDRIPGAQYDRALTSKGIDEGIVCLLLVNNMSGGSEGDLDLYSLLHHYPLNKEYRDAINKVLKEKRGY